MNLDLELGPTEQRMPTTPLAQYPNTLTLRSLIEEAEQRVERGQDPLDALSGVTAGARNWTGRNR